MWELVAFLFVPGLGFETRGFALQIQFATEAACINAARELRKTADTGSMRIGYALCVNKDTGDIVHLGRKG